MGLPLKPSPTEVSQGSSSSGLGFSANTHDLTLQLPSCCPLPSSKSGVRSGLRPQRAYLSAGAYQCPVTIQQVRDNSPRDNHNPRTALATLGCSQPSSGGGFRNLPRHFSGWGSRLSFPPCVFYYSGGGWFPPYGRGAELGRVLRGPPSPQSSVGRGPPPPLFLLPAPIGAERCRSRWSRIF